MTLARLKRVLLSLPDVGQRVAWLRTELLAMDRLETAHLLDALCEESERSEPRAREALLTVAILFANLGECNFVTDLRACALAEHLLSLDRLLRPAPPRADHTEALEDQRVPDYGVGRELTLGERRSLARRPNRRDFDRLLADPHPMVIRQLLLNPRLTEDDVVRLATKRPARVPLLQEIAACPRWLCQPRIRLSIIFNPGAPASLVMPLLGLCTRSELVQVVENTTSSKVLRATARELLERRPPLGEPDEADFVLQ